jgi:anaerobic selenocysteine-containing dehydrogenase
MKQWKSDIAMIRKDKKWQKISWDGAFKEIFEKLGRKKEGDSNKVAGIFTFHTSEANFMFARTDAECI